MATLFISDLHLSASRPDITQLFLEFLHHRAADAEALYILGDLVEYWIGDDATTQREYGPMVDGLKGLVHRGTPVYLMVGNRDFLMGEDFARATGVRLLPDPTRIDLYGMPVLLMHGDTLCTEDHEYMAFRALVRSEKWQKEFLGKGMEERDAIVRGARAQSRASTARKAPEIMDVTQAAVEAAMRAHGVRDLIHGHTHRPADHRFELDGRPARRVVLGDWYERGSALVCTPQGWTLEFFGAGQLARSRAAR